MTALAAPIAPPVGPAPSSFVALIAWVLVIASATLVGLVPLVAAVLVVRVPRLAGLPRVALGSVVLGVLTASCVHVLGDAPGLPHPPLPLVMAGAVLMAALVAVASRSAPVMRLVASASVRPEEHRMTLGRGLRHADRRRLALVLAAVVLAMAILVVTGLKAPAAVASVAVTTAGALVVASVVVLAICAVPMLGQVHIRSRRGAALSVQAWGSGLEVTGWSRAESDDKDDEKALSADAHELGRFLLSIADDTGTTLIAVPAAPELEGLYTGAGFTDRGHWSELSPLALADYATRHTLGSYHPPVMIRPPQGGAMDSADSARRPDDPVPTGRP